MSLRNALRHARRPIAVTAAALLLTAIGTLVGAAPQYSISQKGREFHPGDVTIKRGESIQIVNDDADLLHHAYVDSDKFSFDFGRPEARQHHADHLPGGRRFRRAMRHPSEDAARGARAVARLRSSVVDQRIAVPNSSACPT